MTLAHFTGVIMDMDGVVWRGDTLLPGAAQWFRQLQDSGIPFALATNNSSKTPADYIIKCARFGIHGITPQQIITSGTATIAYLQRHYPAGTAVHVLGGDGLRAVVREAGFVVAEDAPVVVVGLDPQLTYEKLKRATFLLRAGAEYVASNVDPTIPLADGLAPGAGSLVAALSTASGRTPTVMGKPNAPMFEAALSVLGTSAAQTLMVGDRLDTDIAGAKALGIQAALVLSGVATRADLVSSAVQPDAVYDDLAALMSAVSGTQA